MVLQDASGCTKCGCLLLGQHCRYSILLNSDASVGSTQHGNASESVFESDLLENSDIPYPTPISPENLNPALYRNPQPRKSQDDVPGTDR